MLPAHRSDLPTAYRGLDGPRDESPNLPTVSPGGCQEAGLLVADQTSVAARGQARLVDQLGGIA